MASFTIHDIDAALDRRLAERSRQQGVSKNQLIKDLLAQATGLPMVIEEEPSLPEGQVYIRFGSIETKVDLSQVTADIAIAVRAFFNLKS